MPRVAKLRNKDGFWASDAGGKTTRFGKVDEVPYKTALRQFREHLARPRPQPTENPPALCDLAGKFLGWVLANRGEKAHAERSRHVGRFQASCREVDTTAIRGADLEKFIEDLARNGHAPDYIEKHVVSVKAMFAKGIKKGWIAATVRPFEGVEPIRKEPKALTEEKLPAGDEIRRLFESADADIHGQMGDILRLYHATGARTGELLAVRARDFQRINKQLVLAKHKRSHTLRQPVPRTITLNSVAYEILSRRIEGLDPDAIVFPRPRDGRPHTSLNMAERFQTVRRRAKVRESITVYSFRHLWISEMLMVGVDALLIARMAGTSVKMIESVYGHFRSQSYHEAQAKLDASRQAAR